MAQEEEKLFNFDWKWTSIIPIAVLGIVEAAAWSLIEDSPKWAKLVSEKLDRPLQNFVGDPLFFAPNLKEDQNSRKT